VLHLIATGTDLLVWVDQKHGGLRQLPPRWLDTFGGATPTNIRAIETTVVVSAFLMAAGVYTRFSTLLVWAGFRFLADLNSQSGGSYDELLKDELFLLLLSAAGNALSFDARFRGKTGDVPAWPRWALVFQLVLVYWSTGMQKVSAGWVPGGDLDALWYILQQPTWQRAPMEWLAPYFPLTQVATAASWWFEQLSPTLLLAMYYRETRTRPGWLRAQFNRIDVRFWYLFVGVGMHAGIETSMEVGAFSTAMVALYACCFHPDEWKRLATRLRLPGRATAAGRRPAPLPSTP
jgi:hypothetical protein